MTKHSCTQVPQFTDAGHWLLAGFKDYISMEDLGLSPHYLALSEDLQEVCSKFSKKKRERKRKEEEKEEKQQQEGDFL